MLKSFLLSLFTSVLLWVNFTGFGYLAEINRIEVLQRYQVSDVTIGGLSVTVLYVGAIAAAPWLIAGILCALTVRDRWLCWFTPLIYLLAAGFSCCLMIRFPFHLSINGSGTALYPSATTVAIFLLLTTFTLVRLLLKRTRSKN